MKGGKKTQGQKGWGSDYTHTLYIKPSDLANKDNYDEKRRARKIGHNKPFHKITPAEK